ncbi:glycosyltransferase [Flavobacterium sp.]|uniref:glycosyltransferase family 2 protein n=1 Tax=Flavobacterium sp. TaxID=239 RepID=UPI0025BD4CF9|nr:glycosyltransferase [Flavobacterium sp.]
MLLSVVIPTCNRQDLLVKCLDAVAASNQLLDKSNYEVIVTDDSSNNETEKILLDQYPWVKWVAGPRKGPASNRNNGAAKSVGEWLVFFDDDCIPDAGVLQAYYSLISTADVDVIEGAIYSDEHIKPLFIAPINLTGGHLWSCNFAINKRVFNALKGFDENYKYPNLEDNDLNRRIKIDGYKMIFGKEARVYHPPRPVAGPKKSALYHESWMYYHEKFGEKKTFKDLISTIVKTRLRTIVKSPKSILSVKAVWMLMQELFYTFKSRKHLSK